MFKLKRSIINYFRLLRYLMYRVTQFLIIMAIKTRLKWSRSLGNKKRRLKSFDLISKKYTGNCILQLKIIHDRCGFEIERWFQNNRSLESLIPTLKKIYNKTFQTHVWFFVSVNLFFFFCPHRQFCIIIPVTLYILFYVHVWFSFIFIYRNR